jgi:hypothetical protein
VGDSPSRRKGGGCLWRLMLGASGSRRSLVLWSSRLGAQPGRVLEDTFRAGVVDELFATDEALLHRQLAPRAEAIREFSR